MQGLKPSCWLIALLLCIEASAQRLPLNQYQTKFPVLANGVLQTFQDSKGWIWIVTGTQVLKYTGANLVTLKPAAGVQVDFCYQVLEINNNIYINGQPNYWVADGDSLRIAKHSVQADAAINLEGKSYWVNQKGLWQNIGGVAKHIIPASLPEDIADNLVSIQDSLLLCHIRSRNLLVFNLHTKKLHQVKDSVYDLKSFANAAVLATHRGVRIISSLSIHGDQIKFNDSSVYNAALPVASCVDVGLNNAIWLTVLHRGLLKIPGDAPPKWYDISDGLPGLGFNHIMKDREGNLWLSMVNGLVKIFPDAASRYTTADGLPYNAAECLLFYNPQQSLLAATIKGLCTLQKNGTWVNLLHRGEPFVCQHLTQDKQGLVALSNDTLYRLHINFQESVIEKKQFVAALGKPCTDIDADRFGSLFVSHHSGVFRIFNGKVSSLPLPDSSFKTLYVDHNDRLWCGQFGGPLMGFHIQDETDYSWNRPIIFQASIPAKQLNAIRVITQDRKGNILAGTRFNGLHILKMNADTVVGWQQVTTRDGLSSDIIWDVAIDKDNRYWMVTDGITMLDMNQPTVKIWQPADYYNISKAYSIISGSNDEFWINTANDIISIPAGIPATRPAKNIRLSITGVWVNDVPLSNPDDRYYELDANENNLLVQFTTNSFTREDLINYAYSLSDDESEHWNNLSTQTSLRLAAIAPGNYHLKIRAYDSYGRQIGNTAALHIRILPPIYARWWFITMCVLFFIGLVYFLYRLRLKQLKKMANIRNHISQNLHDDIGASLTNILLLNEMAKSSTGDETKKNALLSRAIEDTRRIGESLSDIVWNINPANDQLSNVMARMARYAGEMLEGAEVQAALDFPSIFPNEKMNMEQRRDLYLIFKELVHNITRHARARNAVISMQVVENNILLQVADDGVGIPQAQHPGNGLRNINTRTAKWKGTFSIQKAATGGTIAEVKMPLAN